MTQFEYIDLNEEEQRSTREGLSQEALAIFDLLKKPNLEQSELKQIKQVASNLLQLLKEEISQLDQWYEKESTRDRINGKIYDFLYSEETGLPVESYEEEDIDEGYIIVDECKEMCINRKTFFQGTLVNITLQANQSYYSRFVVRVIQI
jgi:hypothetical protein